MAIEGLTENQSDFIERFLKVPKVFNRKEAKKKRKEAAEKFRLFNAEHDLIREEILGLEDPALKSVMLAQLAAAESVIEADPKNLNFEGGHKQLEDVQAALVLHIRKQDAQKAHDQLEKAIARMDEEHPLILKPRGGDEQSDIALTWAFAQEKLKSGKGQNNPSDLDAALKAMGRLEVMMRTAEKAAKNPFDETVKQGAKAKKEAAKGLDPKVQDARRRLLDCFNQLSALRDKLDTQFGEGKSPLPLQMACTSVQKKLDDAVDAKVEDLPKMADDAEDLYKTANKDGEKSIAEAQAWAKDHAAFKVRYAVMQAHPQRKEKVFVKPAFDDITTAYTAAKELAGKHEYAKACTALAKVRNDLKDALDKADDAARFRTLYKERQEHLKALPAPADYPLKKLKKDDKAVRALLKRAGKEYMAKQLTTGLTTLNLIPKGVEDILELHRFAKSFKEYETNWKSWYDPLEKVDADVLALITTEMAYAKKLAKEAQADAKSGEYRSASAKMLAALNYTAKLDGRAEFIDEYLDALDALEKRLKETKDLKGPGGRVAIESYYQALVGDDAKRKSAHDTGDFHLAKAMCERLEDQHDEMMDLAKDAKAYLARKKEFDKELGKLKDESSTAAKEAKATSVAMRDNAVAATARGNWKAAENLLQNALLEIKRAVSDAETAALIDGMQGGTNGFDLNEDSEFKTVYAAFAKIKSHVEGLDKDSMFTKELTAADTKAKSAKALMGKDLVKAEAALNEAADACRAVALKITAAASYAAQLKTTETFVDDAEKANEDKVIDGEIKEAKEAVEAAKEAVKPPARDFTTALNHLAKAQELARKGTDAMEVYKDPVKAAREAMAKAILAYKDPSVSKHLEKHADRLQDVLDKMNDDFDKRKLSDATSKAGQGNDLAKLQVEICKACKKAVGLVDHPALSTPGVEDGHAVTTAEMAEFKRLKKEASDAMDKGSYAMAHKLANDSYWVMMGARKKAKSFDDYLAVKLPAEKELDDLETRSVKEAGPGHDAVKELRATFDAAGEKEKLDNYSGAQKTLDGFLKACKAASDQLDLYDKYVLHKTQAQKALEKVRQLKSPAIETLLVRLEGKDRNADRKGQAFDFVVGAALYQELKDECSAAEGTAATVEDFASEAKLIKAIAEDDVDDLKAAIKKAQDKLQALVDQPSSIYVHGEVMAARKLLASAESKAEDDFAAARLEVENVVDSCVDMALEMAKYDQLNDAAGVAQGLAQKLLKQKPEVELVREDIEKRIARLETAMNAARAAKSNRAQTEKDVEDTITALRDFQKVVTSHKAFLAKRDKVQKSLLGWEKAGARHQVSEDLAEVRKLLDTANTKAADHKHKEADAALTKASLQLDMAMVRAKLALNQKPSVKELKAVLDAPDGSDLLDGIVDKLERSVQRQVMAVAFEARFGCSLEMYKQGALLPKGDPNDEDKHGPAQPEDRMNLPALNIRQFFKEMSKLPDSNTLDNDSMLVFTHQSGEQEGSEYQGSGKKVVMREGDEATSGIYAIAMEHEIGKIDPKAAPKEGEERTAFSWNTLHEVGHAVDDKLGYMKKHGERLAGWKTYGGNVKEPATAIAGEFDFDPDYVAEYMMSTKGRALPIPDPKDCEWEEWTRRMEECRMFVDRAREGNKPWQSASIAAACAIGKYTYVESYEGDWSRYLTAERRFAVSGYQFRAPGEWFSELYAAMCAGRLNDNHPHRDEIMALCMKEKK